MNLRSWFRARRVRRSRRHVAPFSDVEMRALRDESPRPFGRDGS